MHTTLPKAFENGYITIEMLDEARTIVDGLVDEWRALGDLSGICRGQGLLSRITWEKYDHFRNGDAIKETFCYLQEQDDTYRSIRSETALLQGSRSFFARHRVSEENSAEIMYLSGIRASMASWKHYYAKHKDSFANDDQICRNEGFQEASREMIKWMQKSKARALTDLLGLEISIPANLETEIQKSEETVSMTQQYRELLERIAEASISRKLPLRQELRNLENEMRTHETLRPIMDIRWCFPGKQRYPGTRAPSWGQRHFC
jgi:hypothetical protein